MVPVSGVAEVIGVEEGIDELIIVYYLFAVVVQVLDYGRDIVLSDLANLVQNIRKLDVV